MPTYIFNGLFSSSVICPYFFGRFLYILRMLIRYMEQIIFFRSPFASVSVLSLFCVVAQSDGPAPVTSGVPRLGAVLPGPAPLARGRSPHEGFLHGLRGRNAC